MSPQSDKPILLSVVMPVYRGAGLLDDTFARLIAWEKELPGNTQIEIIAVDDHSNDDSYAKILEKQKQYPGKIRAIRLAYNIGSIRASYAGMSVAKGDCLVGIPQDLQEPLEVSLRMFMAWREGVKINLSYRKSRTDPVLKKLLANIYHIIFRLFVAPNYPRGGLGSFLIDRQIIDELCRRSAKSRDIMTQLFMMGGDRQLHEYHRESPKTKSNWTLRKNIKLVIDNIIGFSYLPVRLMSLAGIMMGFAGFCFAAYVLVGKWFPSLYVVDHPPGIATIIVLLTFAIGMLMLMLGVIGEYLWRILDCVSDEPTFRIEQRSDGLPSKKD